MFSVRQFLGQPDLEFFTAIRQSVLLSFARCRHLRRHAFGEIVLLWVSEWWSDWWLMDHPCIHTQLPILVSLSLVNFPWSPGAPFIVLCNYRCALLAGPQVPRKLFQSPLYQSAESNIIKGCIMETWNPSCDSLYSVVCRNSFADRNERNIALQHKFIWETFKRSFSLFIISACIEQLFPPLIHFIYLGNCIVCWA